MKEIITDHDTIEGSVLDQNSTISTINLSPTDSIEVKLPSEEKEPEMTINYQEHSKLYPLPKYDSPEETNPIPSDQGCRKTDIAYSGASIVGEKDLEFISDPNNLIGEDLILDDPRKWSRKRKNYIMFAIGIAGLTAPIATTIYFPAINSMRKDLHTNEILGNSIIAIFILFWAIGPLGWAEYSEIRETRRNVYLISFTLFIVSSIIGGFSKNIYLVLVMRALQSIGSSGVFSIGAGTIADIYEYSERGTAFGLFYLGPLIGPLIGPIIGSQKKTPRKFNPIAPLFLIRYPFVALPVGYITTVFGLIYIQNALISTTISYQYHLSSSDIGLVMLSPGLGYMVGSYVGGRYSDYVLYKAREKDGSDYPELRIQSGWLGTALVPIGMASYGLMVANGVALAWTVIPIFIAAVGVMICNSSLSTYLVDAFPSQSASAMAVNGFFRYLSAALMSILAQPLEKAIGTTWVFVLPSIILALGTGMLILVLYKGRDWRDKVKDV
ncbi:hypothetical protein G9A89_005648 [Geosiphon pyriformis]|nr:hypothetical protein G9A89_005648 [Geosiphon pyriformis]